MSTPTGLYRSPLFPDAQHFPCIVEGADLERQLPHRAPMRLLDRLLALDPGGRRALGTRFVDPDDPVLAGHFPGEPIYPGVLQLELMGQTGLLLLCEQCRPRIVGVESARFLDAVRPGDVARAEVVVLDEDSLRGRIAAQIWVRQRLCSAAVLEVYLA
ncbi:MAG: beta-hydroxyacyl-ACP dehydratase [Myxococcales bacterium]|nr:beta-hydroxyacyl-ACP dehydratase [Myxococcales bacterium]